MSKINLTTVKIFGEKYALDTFLIIFFGPLMASGIIDAWRFCRTIVVSIPVIVAILQEATLFREQPDNYLEMHSISH
ncbi:hypothetical protein [Chitinophaga niabensis]|uniref:Uncharacterized protein n=1 Tax=Chitinophaga niabensis TaxID=536979 RepID=A0A1N6DEU9_9BACT|nr:hypothetical protein [Chitinophaga niabensis]SIN69321.1 hypothetical protein SAMN04488055_0678 [Chitinophaga niabensis]